MINSKANIFEFATKELSQDAVFCYILDCFNDSDKKSIALAFLELIKIPNIENIISLCVKQQEDHIDVKATIEYLNEDKKFLIIEDKVFSSIHDNQLMRYREETRKRENCADNDIIGIFFKIGKRTEAEKDACEKAGYSFLDYQKFNDFIQEYSKVDFILELFSEFFAERIRLHNQIDKWESCDFKDISKQDFDTNLISNRYGQYKVMSWLMRKIFEDSHSKRDRYNENKQHSENNYGSACTQYRFIFDPNDKKENWNLEEEEMPRYNCCFFRIDRNKKGWYIAIRMYFPSGATADQSDDASRTRSELLNLIENKDDVSRLSGKKEKTLLLFNFDSIEKLNSCYPKLKEAADYLLSRI